MRLHFGYILGLFAILLATSAGYISVVGWGKLFAGEATIVMIIMGIIEAAKIIATIYLHRYGKSEPKPKKTNGFVHFFKSIFSLKTYMVIAVVFTMLLTSVGIYGFLTGAYQDTANKMELHDGEIGILTGKRDIFKQKITDNKEVINNKNNRSNQLSDLRTQQEARLQQLIIDEHWSNARKTRQEIAAANKEIQKLTEDIDVVIQKNSELADSVSVYQVQILELNGSSEIAAEIGPLKYVSTLTGRPMGSIINWIVLVIIFIFDPMAIGFVIAANKVFDKNSKGKGDDVDDNGDNPDPTPNHPPVVDDKVDDEPKEVNPIIGEEDVFFSAPDYSKPAPNIETIEDEVEEIVEPEPSGTTNEQIVDSVDNIKEDIVYEQDIIEGIEEDIPEEEIIEDAKVEEVTNKLEQPEDQIKENKQSIKESIVDKIKNSLKKSPPVITTGNVKREEIKEIKEGTRGYSVKVPEPKRVGTNKEVRKGEENKFYFRRPKN